MERSDIRYDTYVRILKEELVPAMGCTEPIALAYAAAKAREVLTEDPDRVELKVSGSIIKNVKSVIVPNTGNMKGIPAAVAAGVVAGKAELELEVLSEVTPEQIPAIQTFLDTVPVSVEHVELGHVFDIIITLFCGRNYVTVRIADHHTEIVLIEKNGEKLLEKQFSGEDGGADRSLLTMEGIWDFTNSVCIGDVKELLDRQIQYNVAISEEGLRGSYGSSIGRVLLQSYGNTVSNRARAKAAAGSDARMNGCELPVVINSGSGNQGITCSVPVVVYAEELGCNQETLYRALILSNLVSVHCKSGIGTLSAYCGAVTAGAGAGAGIVYLYGGSYEAMTRTVINALAIVSGIVCDGAKASCAAKIASAVDAAILGYNMYISGHSFHEGDGIIMERVEDTIRGIGLLGREGMRETNDEIIRIMFGLKQ